MTKLGWLMNIATDLKFYCPNRMDEAAIYREFRGEWVLGGNEYFVAKDSAIAFAAHIYKRKLRLLGIDGFILGKDLTQPIMKAIADYSSGPATESEVMHFLQASMPQVTHFSFALDLP